MGKEGRKVHLLTLIDLEALGMAGPL